MVVFWALLEARGDHQLITALGPWPQARIRNQSGEALQGKLLTLGKTQRACNLRTAKRIRT